MKLVDDLNYRQWQKRNSSKFKKLDKVKQKELRDSGYFNVGWLKVRQSWKLLNKETFLSTLFDHRLAKGDLEGALTHSILEAEEAQNIAREALTDLKKQRKELDEIAKKARSKKLFL